MPSKIKLPDGIVVTGKLGIIASINPAPPELRKGDELFTAAQMKAAVLQERDRCAKICESVAHPPVSLTDDEAIVHDAACTACADLIRSN